VAYKTIAASTSLARGGRYLSSYALTENAGTPAAARVLLRNKDVNGDIVVDVRLAASETRHVALSRPVYFPDGIYVHVSAGTVRGSLDVT
jgi:hypothetical protein